MHAEVERKLFLSFYWAALDNFGGLPGRVGAWSFSSSWPLGGVHQCMVDGSKRVCAALMPPNYAAIDACDLGERERERLHESELRTSEGGR
jgi:hypothetical protein